ncbi:MAG TPA: MarR family transcriptional regulator [Candidatus Eisenbergiella stercoravium]|nr:MarR family transcriptional regulator [Candidatus Eisenbergiella stercoravium]
MAEENTCSVLLKQIHDELKKMADNSLRANDLTMAQLGALLVLNRTSAKQLSYKELEKELHVAQSTTTGIVDRLEQKGFVECFGSAQDRRIKVVRLTQTGERCCYLADRHLEEAEERLLSGLTETERMIFHSLLIKVHRSIR